MSEPSQEVIFTSSEPSLAMVYDRKTNLHSVYKIRKVTSEERNFVTRSIDTTNTPLGATSYNSSGRHCSKSRLSFLSNDRLSSEMNNHSITYFSRIGNRTTLSPVFGSKSNSYITSNSPSMQQQQGHQHSRSQSPMATISRCQSPTNLAFPGMSPIVAGNSSHHSRLHQTMMASMFRRSIHGSVSENHFNTMRFRELERLNSKVLYPEIILDHVWTESSTTSK